MNFILITFLLSITSLALSSRVSYEGYNVWSIVPKTKDDVTYIRQWENIEGIDIWELGRPGKQARIMVAPLTEKPFLDFLDTVGIQYDLLIENVERNFEKEREQLARSQEQLALEHEIEGKHTVDLNHFWTTREINNYIDYLMSFYRDICRVDVIGHSIQGSLIRSVAISVHGEVDGSRPIIFIDAGIHAREWISYMVAVKILHELCEHSNDHLDILNNVDFVIVPVVNPDGYEYTHSTNRMWRKNRRINENPNCPGVDCNRNYAFMWQFGTNQCSETFSGAAPFSEPEPRAIRSIIDRYEPAIKLYTSLHSYGDYVIYPWGYDYINIDNWEQHHEVGDRFADAVYAVNGTQYDVGNAAILLYPGYGFSDDYTAYRGIPLSYTVELSGGAGNGFDLPADQIPRVTTEAWLGMRQFGLYTAEHEWD